MSLARRMKPVITTLLACCTTGGSGLYGYVPYGSGPYGSGPRRVRSSNHVRLRARVMPTESQSRQSGFTLVELALVLVVVGLILGGVMKGQALIDTARVRSLMTDVNGIRSAWYSFQERYRSLPGDFPNAPIQIDSAAIPGNGNGRIDDGQERASVWQQLALAGFINGNFNGVQASTGTAHDVDCADDTCPRNPYNGYYKISFSTQALDASGPANEFFTGGQIPVNILAQIDSRLDDGNARSGRFRVHKAYANSCTTDGEWDVATGHVNCAGVLRE